MVTLALDRIKSIKVISTLKYIDNVKFDANEYYKDVIGVTVNEGNRPQTVHMAIDRSNAPYVITKPFHHSQKIVSKSSEGIEITIDVVINYELEREILGFGECITVIKPKKLRERIEAKLKKAVEQYEVLSRLEE